jgi:hypothetical protein
LLVGNSLAQLVQRLAQVVLRRTKPQVGPQQFHQGFTAVAGSCLVVLRVPGDGFHNEVDQQGLDLAGAKWRQRLFSK